MHGVSKTEEGEYGLSQNQLFAEYEQTLFTHVVSMAEKQGKPVEPVVVPGLNPFDAMVQTASKLKASRPVMGISARMASEEPARRIGRAWENCRNPVTRFPWKSYRRGHATAGLAHRYFQKFIMWTHNMCALIMHS